MAQVVENLPSIYKALVFDPKNLKKERKRGRGEGEGGKK
jgi:hypothetical protein